MSPRRKWNTSTSGTRRPPVIRGWWDRGVRRAGDKPVVSSRRWKTCETVTNPIAVRAGSARLRELARSYRGKNDNGPWRAVDKLPACPTNRRNVEKFSREWLLVKWRGKKKKKKKGVNGIGRSARFRRQIWDYFSNELRIELFPFFVYWLSERKEWTNRKKCTVWWTNLRLKCREEDLFPFFIYCSFNGIERDGHKFGITVCK